MTTERGVKLRIECAGLHGRAARVWLDDEEIGGSVSRVVVEWDVHDVTRATITYLVRELEVASQIGRAHV